MMMYSFAS